VNDDGRELFSQRTALWRWVGGSGGNWFFVRFTDQVAEAISALAAMRRLETGRRRGWGSLKVVARIGGTSWRTSIFPGDGDTWLLPVKRSVREAETLTEGEDAEVEISF